MQTYYRHTTQKKTHQKTEAHSEHADNAEEHDVTDLLSANTMGNIFGSGTYRNEALRTRRRTRRNGFI